MQVNFIEHIHKIKIRDWIVKKYWFTMNTSYEIRHTLSIKNVNKRERGKELSGEALCVKYLPQNSALYYIVWTLACLWRFMRQRFLSSSDS